MAVNGFDEPLNSEPSAIRVGDFISWWCAELADSYPPDQYTLSYVGTLEGETPEKIEIAAAAHDGSFLVSVAGSDSSGWTPGAYQWAAFITRSSDGERRTVRSGRLEVLPDLSAGELPDLRSHARRMLEQLEALIEGRAKSNVASYEILGRKLTKLSPKELSDWHSHYRKLVKIEERTLKGRGNHRIMKVGFN